MCVAVHQDLTRLSETRLPTSFVSFDALIRTRFLFPFALFRIFSDAFLDALEAEAEVMKSSCLSPLHKGIYIASSVLEACPSSAR